MSWKNLKIKTKLTLAFGSVLLLIVLISSFALYSFFEIEKKASTLNNETLPISIISNKISMSAFKITTLNQNFGYSLEKEYLDEDRKFLDSLKHYLDLKNSVDTAKVEGMQEQNIINARNGVKAGYSNEIIKTITGLSDEIIENIRLIIARE